MNDNGMMCADTTIKYDPSETVLKFQIGGTIAWKEDGCMRLSSAFFGEIESKSL
jgi:hypothetical protein